MPYKVWSTGDIPSAADFNSSAWADPLTADVVTNENSTATTYGDLATVGPAVSGLQLVNGQACLVIVSALMATVTPTSIGYMSFAVSGASTLAALDTNAATVSWNVNGSGVFTRLTLFVATATGSHTFTCKYKTNGNNMGFSNRRLIVKKF